MIEFYLHPLQRTQTYNTHEQVTCIAVMHSAGLDILFPSHLNSSVRSHSIKGNTLQVLTSVTMRNPSLLMWDRQREVLFVVDEEKVGTQYGHNVLVLTEEEGDRALNAVHTNLHTHSGMQIRSWCLSTESRNCRLQQTRNCGVRNHTTFNCS